MAIVDVDNLDMRQIAQSMGSRITVRQGQAVFRRGDPADQMYVLLCGAIAVSAGSHVIEVLKPGDGLGILSLIDRQPRSADAVAAEDSELVLIDARRFRYMVEEVPNFCWYVMNEMAQRLRATNAAL